MEKVIGARKPNEVRFSCFLSTIGVSVYRQELFMQPLMGLLIASCRLHYSCIVYYAVLAAHRA